MDFDNLGCQQTTVRLRKDRGSIDALLRLQIMRFREFLFTLISNITSFPISIPRIVALGDIESAQNVTDVAIFTSCYIQQV
jgi:hypothetical protein